jgi:hypothetical protein
MKKAPGSKKILPKSKLNSPPRRLPPKIEAECPPEFFLRGFYFIAVLFLVDHFCFCLF